MANRFSLPTFIIASDVDSDWAIAESSNIVSEVHAERQVGKMHYQNHGNPMYTVPACALGNVQVPVTGRGAKNSAVG